MVVCKMLTCGWKIIGYLIPATQLRPRGKLPPPPLPPPPPYYHHPAPIPQNNHTKKQPRDAIVMHTYICHLSRLDSLAHFLIESTHTSSWECASSLRIGPTTPSIPCGWRMASSCSWASRTSSRLAWKTPRGVPWSSSLHKPRLWLTAFQLSARGSKARCHRHPPLPLPGLFTPSVAKSLAVCKSLRLPLIVGQHAPADLVAIAKCHDDLGWRGEVVYSTDRNSINGEEIRRQTPIFFSFFFPLFLSPCCAWTKERQDKTARAPW